MESELMEAGGIVEASFHRWSGICLWGNGPQERPVFLPHTVQRSESNMDAFDDHIQAHATTHKHRYTHAYNETPSGANMMRG